MLVDVIGDKWVETDNTFFVKLNSPVGANIVDDTGTGLIKNDDGQQPPPASKPSISINDVTVKEGNSGKTAMVFTVKLDKASNQAVSVQYTTGGGSANAANDYDSASGLVTFAAGQTSKTITVYAIGDTWKETDNTFYVTFSSAINATVGDATGMGLITNDD